MRSHFTGEAQTKTYGLIYIIHKSWHGLYGDIKKIGWVCMQIFGNIAKYFVRAVKKEKEKYVNKTLIYI